MHRVTISFTLPSMRDIVDAVQTALLRAQRPIDSPRNVLGRFSRVLFLLNSLMCMALVLGGTVDGSSPIAPGSGWRDVYVVAFGVASILGLIHLIVFNKSTDGTWEFRLRLTMFAVAITAATGWLLLATYNAVQFHGDWTTPVPWLFILYYLLQAFRTYIEYIDKGTIEKVARQLPDA